MYPSEPFPHFVDDYLAYLYEVQPSQASLDGVHLHDDLLEDLSRSAVDAHVRALSGFGRRHDAGGHRASLKARGYSPICKTSADSMAMVEAALHPVILTTTAVVSSFGGMSQRNSPTAAKIVSTIARAD